MSTHTIEIDEKRYAYIDHVQDYDFSQRPRLRLFIPGEKIIVIRYNTPLIGIPRKCVSIIGFEGKAFHTDTFANVEISGPREQTPEEQDVWQQRLEQRREEAAKKAAESAALAKAIVKEQKETFKSSPKHRAAARKNGRKGGRKRDPIWNHQADVKQWWKENSKVSQDARCAVIKEKLGMPEVSDRTIHRVATGH
jgi:hypothetical protein